MKAQEHQLLPFLNGKKQFIIPIYQRSYSWRREQCEQLWNDIIRVGTDQSLPGHFLGSVVYIQQGLFQIANIPQLLLIDGQQRLTTLMLLLIALAASAQNDKKSSYVSKEDIYDSYLINKFGRDEQRYKLLLTHDDREILQMLIDHPEKVTSIKTGSRLIDNYLFFLDQLQQPDVDLDTIFLGISKLIIVDISLDKDHDNPQLIFESLNSTGMDLSQADLIRNYVLMGLDNEEQTRLYKEYWYPIEQKFRYGGTGDQFDRFMRDYLTLKQGVIPNIDKVYVTFKLYHRTRYQTPIQEVVEDIARYAEYFANMAFLHEEDKDIKQAMRDINALKVDVAYPFFLEVYNDYRFGRINKTDFITIIRLVESFVFRRAICGILTNSLNKIFATLTREIDRSHYLESVQAALLTKTASGRFPRDDEFRAAFVVKDVYNFPRRNYLLRKLENYKRKEPIAVENYTIEHIMPQNPRISEVWQRELGPDWKDIHSRYLHTIGNLTLTGYNSELSDRPFHEKCTVEGGFDHSPLRLNQSVAHAPQWDQEAIEKRAEALAEEAIKIWATPLLTAEQVSKYSSRQGKKSYLAEVFGPTEHPLAGFIPEGFRLVQSSEKRFYLFRKIDGEWVQYTKPKYVVSWDYAKKWIQDVYQSNEIPQGAGGEKILATASSRQEEGEDLTDYLVLESATNGKFYTLADHPTLQGDLLILFHQLRKRILNLSVSVREEIKKHYIAYKLSTNFVDVEPFKKDFLLTLNVPYEEIDDPKRLCRNMSNIGHHGNGDTAVRLADFAQIDDIMYLIEQAFERHNEEAIA